MKNIIEAKIESLSYRPGNSMETNRLKEYEYDDFNINEASSTGILKVDNKNEVAFSKWVTPKRTRSYPFARLYDIYNFGGKRITIIPVIKDEGLGKSKNKSNNDRINFITLSWMNLTNVYVILAWYSDAEKKSDYRITSQTFDNNYVKEKIKEISEYQLDAHHWNRKHFINDFVSVCKKSIKSYKQIGKKLSVEMHNKSKHNKFLDSVVSGDDPEKLDLKKFAEYTLSKSKLAAAREVLVNHEQEYLNSKSNKLVFQIENNLGGQYYLTADELILNTKEKHISIKEAKNTTKDKLPKLADIKDGLFKILLFSQIDNIKIDNAEYTFDVGLSITGAVSNSIVLPKEKNELDEYIKGESLTTSEQKIIHILNQESLRNNYKVIISSNIW